MIISKLGNKKETALSPITVMYYCVRIYTHTFFDLEKYIRKIDRNCGRNSEIEKEPDSRGRRRYNRIMYARLEK
jgi:hypothetical protein